MSQIACPGLYSRYSKGMFRFCGTVSKVPFVNALELKKVSFLEFSIFFQERFHLQIDTIGKKIGDGVSIRVELGLWIFGNVGCNDVFN